MNKIFIFAMIIFLFQNVFANCSDGQIDINSASKEDLDKITWIGPATADKIIAGRPFENLDSLIDVSGIGDKKLADIKSQGLACVEADDTKKESDRTASDRQILTEEVTDTYEIKKISEPEVINLNAQTIKSEENTENSDKNKYAIYGFIIFCILLAILFAKKIIGKKNGLE